MTETASQAAATAAFDKMREGLQDYLDLIADVGEPEVAIGAVVMFESRGMHANGQFARTSYLVLEHSGLTTMLGMLDIAGEKVYDAIRNNGRDDDE